MSESKCLKSPCTAHLSLRQGKKGVRKEDVTSQTTRFIMEESEQEIQGHCFGFIALQLGQQ